MVHGIGINDVAGSTGTRSYGVWAGMLARCYSLSYQVKKPSYIGCSVDVKFLRYSCFDKWANMQVGFHQRFQLDKDLLVKRNKIYCPETCVFLPLEVNMALVTQKRSRGELPIGVRRDKGGGYAAQVYCSGVNTYSRLVGSREEAFELYREMKCKELQRLAEKFKRELDRRAYIALVNYKVEVDD